MLLLGTGYEFSVYEEIVLDFESNSLVTFVRHPPARQIVVRQYVHTRVQTSLQLLVHLLPVQPSTRPTMSMLRYRPSARPSARPSGPAFGRPLSRFPVSYLRSQVVYSKHPKPGLTQEFVMLLVRKR